ncbi:hypothetical protein BJY52DRAFT_661634 [Lactarius psammicola]|nr:hypothetical protein BJY52DRAFT_661634 [Lactarius psammicola]
MAEQLLEVISVKNWTALAELCDGSFENPVPPYFAKECPENSAQEDTLLVLFNTAISNLVLFRNNFALTRDVAGLFQSFQSSSSVLYPESNLSLFQSLLVVIIKDAIDSDKAEVARD